MSVEANHSNDKVPSRNGKSPTTNQEEASLKQRRLDLVFNLVQSRQQLMRQMTERRRDIDKECDYPTTGEITPWTFQDLFDREPISNRVVKCIALESWQVSPEVYDDEDEKVETPFEQAWKDVGKTLRGGQSWYGDEVGSPVWDALLKADIVSGIGAWGLIVLGIDDGLSLDNPLEGVLDPSVLPDQMLTPYDPYSGVASWGVAVPPGSSVQDASTSVGHISEQDLQAKVGTGTSPTKTPPSTKTSTKDTSQDIPYSSQETKGAAKGSKPTRKLIYLRVFKQASVQISRYDSNPASPRRGQPTEYLVTLSDPNSSLGGGAGQLSQTVTVHWTRTVHVADNTIDNEWCGTPRMLPVLNRLLDLRKLYAGSAEMYWLGALPGWAFSTHPQLGGDVEIVQSDIREMMEDYSNGFQRWLTLEGMNPVSLAPQVVDPSPQINICLEAIAIQIGVPVPVLKGYEIGEQASTNNDSDWKGRLAHRENFYISPRIIAPLVDRLIACGVLPTPKDDKYFIKWPDLTTKSDEDKAALGLQKAQTIAAFVSANGETALPLFWFLTTVLDYTQDEAKTIIEEASKVHEEQQQQEAEQGLAQQQATHEQKLQQDKEKIAAGTMAPPAVKKANPFAAAPSINYSPDQPRDSDGKFGSGGASTSSQGKGVIQSIKGLGAKAGHYEHIAKEYVTSKVESNVSKLPPKIQAAVRAAMFVGKKLTQAAFASYTAGQAFAERVAKERGATEEQAKTLRNVLAASDIALAKPIAIGTGATGLGGAVTLATGFIPAATAGYLAYSTARNPLATYRAARDVVRQGITRVVVGGARKPSMADSYALPTRNEEGQEVVYVMNLSEANGLKIANAVADHGYSDWYVAILMACIEETQDVEVSLSEAARIYAETPEDPSVDQDLDDQDEFAEGDDGSDLIENSNPDGCNQYTGPECSLGEISGSKESPKVMSDIKQIVAMQRDNFKKAMESGKFGDLGREEAANFDAAKFDKNWMKTLKGLKADPKDVAEVQKSVDEAYKHYDIPHVPIVVRKLTADENTIGENAHWDNGFMVIRPNVHDELRYRSSVKDLSATNKSTVKDAYPDLVAGLIVHELGHKFHEDNPQLTPNARMILSDPIQRKDVAARISSYASTHYQELVAEAYATSKHPDFHKSDESTKELVHKILGTKTKTTTNLDYLSQRTHDGGTTVDNRVSGDDPDGRWITTDAGRHLFLTGDGELKTGPTGKTIPTKGGRRDGSTDSQRARGSNAGRSGDAGHSGRVEGKTSPTGGSGGDRGGHAPGQSPHHGPAEGVPTEVKSSDSFPKPSPADVETVNKRLDRYEKLFQGKGNHQAAEWMGKLREHVNSVGTDGLLASLQATKGKGGDEKVQYGGINTEDSPNWNSGKEFISAYLNRAGIIPLVGQQAKGDVKVIHSQTNDDPFAGRAKTPIDFKPTGPAYDDKLQEAKDLPGLQRSEDIGKVMGHEVTHLTPEVTAKMDAEYGKGGWLIKTYGDYAFAGQGIFFPQRIAQVHQDAQNTIWHAGEQLDKYGFKLARDTKTGEVQGIVHSSGDTYHFGNVKHWEEDIGNGKKIQHSEHEGTEHYNNTINGEVKKWADRAAIAAENEKGVKLPFGGKDFMVQPAFAAVGVSEKDRAEGRTIAPGEGRVHLVVRDGKAEVIPHTTWIKGDPLPVVFESADTKAMAKAAQDVINSLPKEARNGQIYAPDVLKTKDGYKVVELNASVEYGGSGYLSDNPLVIDSFVSHLTNREPAHVQFIRKLLSKSERVVNSSSSILFQPTREDRHHNKLTNSTFPVLPDDSLLGHKTFHIGKIETNDQLKEKYSTKQTVPLDQLYGTQKTVNINVLKEYLDADDYERPIIARQEGKLFIVGGHHRLEAEKVKGATTAKVRVVDFDEYGKPLPVVTDNSFCATGEGGGVDPSCSPGEGGSGAEGGVLSVAKTTSLMSAGFKKDRRQMNGGDCGDAARTLQRVNPAFKAYAVTTKDPYDKTGEGRGITHLMVSADGGKTFVDGQGVRTPKQMLKNSDPNDKPEIVTAEYHHDKDSRYGGYYIAKGSPEKFEAKGNHPDVLDRLGLTSKDLVKNAFCATGEGGGIDPSCSPTSGHSSNAGVTEKVPSAKAATAKASAVLVDKNIQRYAEDHNEPRVAKALGGHSLPDSEPVDVAIAGDNDTHEKWESEVNRYTFDKAAGKKGAKLPPMDLSGNTKHGIELKTMVSNENSKLTMDSYSQVRKALWEKERGSTFHTIVSDDRKVYNANGEGKHGDDKDRAYYYRRGIAGSARVETMHKVADEVELKKLMEMKESDLPEAARRTDGHITSGDWKAFTDEKGKGFRDTKTGKEFRAKK